MAWFTLITGKCGARLASLLQKMAPYPDDVADMAKGEVNFDDAGNHQHRPSPTHAERGARLMGSVRTKFSSGYPSDTAPIASLLTRGGAGISVSRGSKAAEPKIHCAVTLRQRETAVDGGRSRQSRAKRRADSTPPYGFAIENVFVNFKRFMGITLCHRRDITGQAGLCGGE